MTAVKHNLLRAAELIEQEGWCQGSLFEANAGFCLNGALYAANGWEDWKREKVSAGSFGDYLNQEFDGPENMAIRNWIAENPDNLPFDVPLELLTGEGDPGCDCCVGTFFDRVQSGTISLYEVNDDILTDKTECVTLLRMVAESLPEDSQ